MKHSYKKSSEQVEVQESSEINDPQTAFPLQAMIAIAVIITTILKHVKAYVQEIPEMKRKATQVAKSTTTGISCNKLIQNIKKSYETAVLAMNIVTNPKDRTSHTIIHQTTNRQNLIN